MSDQFDKAEEFEQLHRDIALKFRKPEVSATGFCLSCGEPMQNLHKFCDKDCATDWQREQDARERNK